MRIQEMSEDFASVYPPHDRHFAEECYEQGAKDMRDRIWAVLFDYFNSDLPFDKEWFMTKTEE